MITGIKINKEVFSLGDEININASVVNNLNETLYLQYLVLNIKESAISSSVEVKPLEARDFLVYSSKIDSNFKNGNYSILLRLVDKKQNHVYSNRNLSFIVKDLLNEFNAELKTCADISCQTPKKVFAWGENIYLDYSSSISDVKIDATLTYPDKKTKKITLPYSFKAGQIGTYNLDISATKQGYGDVSKAEMFGVIEKQAVIKSFDEKGNEISPTLKSEDNINFIDEIKGAGFSNLILVIVIIIGIVILIVILYRARQRRIKEKYGEYAQIRYCI